MRAALNCREQKKTLTWGLFRSADNTPLKGDGEPYTSGFLFIWTLSPKGLVSQFC